MTSASMATDVSGSRTEPGIAANAAALGRPLVSVVMPAFNEAAVIEANLQRVCRYMAALEHEYRWEMLIINDGSADQTGELAERFARTRENVRVYHHLTNF